MKNFVVEVTLTGNPHRKLFVIDAEDELDAIDKVQKHCVNDLKQEIIDIEVI